MRGQQQRLKMEAIQEMKAKVQKEVQEEDRTQLARQLIGPRGGLPTHKDDLVRLARLICCGGGTEGHSGHFAGQGSTGGGYAQREQAKLVSRCIWIW